SYPTLIAQKLDIPEWTALTMQTRYRSLADIDLDGIEYDHRTGSGVILVNWGPVLEGKLLLLLAGSSGQQEALKRELAARL
ncbi:MAG: ATP-grasp domain-containing protein, partial [Sedimenticolaceae bacterium]